MLTLGTVINLLQCQTGAETAAQFPSVLCQSRASNPDDQFVLGCIHRRHSGRVAHGLNGPTNISEIEPMARYLTIC
jgi:hypothetical protein